jgi:hypothetical protein
MARAAEWSGRRDERPHGKGEARITIHGRVSAGRPFARKVGRVLQERWKV